MGHIMKQALIWIFISNSYQQELQCASAGSGDTVIINELVTLRYYESDLEEKLSRLKESRNHLMAEIEALMNLLQVKFVSSIL